MFLTALYIPIFRSKKYKSTRILITAFIKFSLIFHSLTRLVKCFSGWRGCTSYVAYFSYTIIYIFRPNRYFPKFKSRYLSNCQRQMLVYVRAISIRNIYDVRRIREPQPMKFITKYDLDKVAYADVISILVAVIPPKIIFFRWRR